ncbi:VOC family protein [Janthinobacterium agaricidamnosum]|uniref:Glyoxalase/Bleomycin resistance /Dioxygenase superfamily protein n=1 Tax=Janthinobacterium agaricidamnosum NBRC 102515 = DSM 9628 TaxID=1349767 RepID=W0V0S6_9BURK|nr:VOC family protein [Janthinobacterium agaricidamnosum]CDG80902.1 glyoxalase/Bleomycin resistance /Dioxygenase superfamily protein [Janthinobacterium agaricidamnosum NBRC 102515 = DSM 9628]
MINLHDIRYVRLGTRDLATAEHYATTVLGLQVARREANALYLRSDSRDHTLCYFEGDPGDHTTAFEVESGAAFDAAAATLEANNFRIHLGNADECEQRHVRGFLTFQDPTGNKIDLVLAPHHSGQRYFPSRDVKITGFSHVGLRTTDPKRDEAFWTTLCSAKVSDWIGDAPLLRIDDIHHKIALFPSTYAGIQHINHQVESIDELMRAYYILLEKKIAIRFGPGRHPTSGAMFLYFEGTDGLTFEYSTGVRSITEEDERTYLPRQFPFAPESFCQWGARPDIPEFKR